MGKKLIVSILCIGSQLNCHVWPLDCKKVMTVLLMLFMVLQVPGSIESAPAPNKAAAASKVDCLIDAKKGYSIATNIYQCPSFKTCCLEYAKPSCCGSKPSSQILQEQVTLWGGLFGILLVIGGIVFCRKKDPNFDITACCCCLKWCTKDPTGEPSRRKNKVAPAPSSDSVQNNNNNSNNKKKKMSKEKHNDGWSDSSLDDDDKDETLFDKREKSSYL